MVQMIKRFKISKGNLILLLIVTAGLLLRVYHISFRSLWGDEVDSLFKSYKFILHDFRFSVSDISGMIRASTSHFYFDDTQMPLYYALLCLWSFVFGLSEPSLRGLSVVFGVLSIPLIYFLARRLFNERTAFYSALLLCFSSFHLMYSQEIRTYSLLLLLSLLSTWYFVRLIREENKMNWLGCFFFSLLLVCTHIYGILTIASQSVYTLYLCSKKDFRSLMKVFLIQFLCFVVLVPKLVSVALANFDVVVKGVNFFPSSSYNFACRFALSVFAQFFGETVAPWNYPVVIPGILASLVILFLLAKNWDGGEGLILCSVLALFPPVVSAIFLKDTLPNFLIGSLPFSIMLASYAVSRARPILRYLLLAVILLVNFVSIHNYFSLAEYHNSNRIEPWKQVAEQITARFRPGDVVVAGDYFSSFRLMEYYLNVLPHKNIPVILASDMNGGINRFFLVTSIHDNGRNRLVRELSHKYGLVYAKGFVPYRMTLASKLRIKPHNVNENRMDLYYFSK